MTALEMFDKAMVMCGYATAEGVNGRDDLLRKAVTIINLVYADLYTALVATPGDNSEIPQVKNVRENIDLPANILIDVMPYGVAMHLAQNECDADNQNLFAALYNQKRSRYVRTEKIKDVLPCVWG